MPGTLVAIGRNSPASRVPGFMSNVSLWLGPPSIHSRIQDLCRAPVVVAFAASTSSQPDKEVSAAPAAANFNTSRRDRSAELRALLMGLCAPFRLRRAAGFGPAVWTAGLTPAARHSMIETKFA